MSATGAPPTAAMGLLPRRPQGTYHGGHREEVGVVAAFLQVHHDVEQRHLVPAPLGVQRLEVAREDELVVLPAQGTGRGGLGTPGLTSLSEGSPQGGRGPSPQETPRKLRQPGPWPPSWAKRPQGGSVWER